MVPVIGAGSSMTSDIADSSHPRSWFQSHEEVDQELRFQSHDDHQELSLRSHDEVGAAAPSRLG